MKVLKANDVSFWDIQCTGHAGLKSPGCGAVLRASVSDLWKVSGDASIYTKCDVCQGVFAPTLSYPPEVAEISWLEAAQRLSAQGDKSTALVAPVLALAKREEKPIGDVKLWWTTNVSVDPNFATPVDVFWGHYSGWCMERGCRPASVEELTQTMLADSSTRGCFKLDRRIVTARVRAKAPVAKFEAPTTSLAVPEPSTSLVVPKQSASSAKDLRKWLTANVDTKGGRVYPDTLHQNYRIWCAHWQLPVLPIKDWERALSAQGLTPKMTPKGLVYSVTLRPKDSASKVITQKQPAQQTLLAPAKQETALAVVPKEEVSPSMYSFEGLPLNLPKIKTKTLSLPNWVNSNPHMRSLGFVRSTTLYKHYRACALVGQQKALSFDAWKEWLQTLKVSAKQPEPYTAWHFNLESFPHE